MRKLHFTAVSVCIVCAAAVCTPRQDVTVTRYEGADYIFAGTLIKLSASTMPGYVSAEEASIVRVDRVLKASDGHEHFEGKEITVLLNEDQKTNLKEGFSGIFITRTWLFGNSLAVLAKAIDQDKSQIEKVQKDIKEYEADQEYRMLESRVMSADLIVYGKVEKIEDVKATRQPVETEHDPQYRIAIVIPEEVLKRSASVDTVKFYFASSDDIQWYKAPKFVAGSEGIFLLRRAPDVSKDQGAYTLLHPLDFQEGSKLDDIKRMIK